MPDEARDRLVNALLSKYGVTGAQTFPGLRKYFPFEGGEGRNTMLPRWLMDARDNAMSYVPQDAALAANFIVPGARVAARITPRGNGMYDVHVGDRFAGTASVAGDGSKPFISAIDIEPEFRRSGIARSLYDRIEEDIGRPLVPSPLGLSPEAMSLWGQRLSRMDPSQRKALLDESREIGRSYGIKDSDIESRLAPLDLLKSDSQ